MINPCLNDWFQTISQYAFKYKMSRQGVHQAIKQGRLDAFSLGPIFLIAMDAKSVKEEKKKPSKYPKYVSERSPHAEGED